MIPAKNRERKCSTCKHYQPSPLWRKGWCRNPLLYDRNTNHLVEGDSLACNRTFIDYWEPIEGPVRTPGPQPRGKGGKNGSQEGDGAKGNPRIAPSIPMDTVDAQGKREVFTGNTPATGMPAVSPRNLSRPVPYRDRPSLAIVSPEYDDEDDLLDPDEPKITRQMEQIEGADEGESAEPRINARQRIKQARAQQRTKQRADGRTPRPKPKWLQAIPLSGWQLWAVAALIPILLLAAGGALVLGIGNRGPNPTGQGGGGVNGGVFTSTVTIPPATPTGFGDPTAIIVITPTNTVPPAVITVPDEIGLGVWVQVVNTADGLRVRDVPGTGANSTRIGALAPGAKVRVVGGPQAVDGTTWWQVEGFNPANPTAQGWCAAQFLRPTTPPTPTP